MSTRINTRLDSRGSRMFPSYSQSMVWNAATPSTSKPSFCWKKEMTQVGKLNLSCWVKKEDDRAAEFLAKRKEKRRELALSGAVPNLATVERRDVIQPVLLANDSLPSEGQEVNVNDILPEGDETVTMDGKTFGNEEDDNRFSAWPQKNDDGSLARSEHGDDDVSEAEVGETDLDGQDDIDEKSATLSEARDVEFDEQDREEMAEAAEENRGELDFKQEMSEDELELF